MENKNLLNFYDDQYIMKFNIFILNLFNFIMNLRFKQKKASLPLA